MSFLAPLFLAGLTALAVPVLIHLIQRERRRRVEFPSLMFVRKIPYQSIRRRSLRHRALLALRCLAVILIVLAFARPLVRRPALAAAAAGGARELVVLLDRSASMGYGDRWDRAREAAREAVGSLGGGDRATLVTFGTTAEAVVRSSSDGAQLRRAIDDARVGAGATRYAPALKLADSLLAGSTRPRRDVILISDFQKSGWTGAGGVRFPDGVTLTPVPIADDAASNHAVSAVRLQRADVAGRERVTLVAMLSHRGRETPAPVEVALEIDGHPAQRARVTPRANGSAPVSFAPVALTGPFTRVSVRAAPDALPQDDEFHLVLSPARRVPILIVEPPSAPAGASLYLERALGIGDAPAFAVETIPVSRLDPRALDGRAVVVLNGAMPASGPALDRLERFVRNGGGLLALAGGLRGGGPDWLPAAIGAAIDRDVGGEATLGAIDYSHPAFELFRAPRGGDLAAARFLRYRRLEPSSGARTIAAFDDGAPALVEAAIGRGRAIAWASTLDTTWNDLPLKPVFLPFVQRLAAYLAGHREPPPWLTVGQIVDAFGRPGGEHRDTAAEPDPVPRLALTPSGARVRLDGADGGWLVLEEQGFYELRDRGDGAPRPATIAANLDPSESDLTPADPQEIAAAVTGRAQAGGPADAPPEPTPEERERRQSIWWYLLLAGLAVLAAETAISNRLSAHASHVKT